MNTPYICLTDKAGTPLLALFNVRETPQALEAECYCLIVQPKKGIRVLFLERTGPSGRDESRGAALSKTKNKFKRPPLKTVGLIQWKKIKVEKQNAGR